MQRRRTGFTFSQKPWMLLAFADRCSKRCPVQYQYWDWLVTAVERLRSRPSILVGDFNARVQSRAIRRIASMGWQIATPPQGWSFRSKKGELTAIDHAFVSPKLRIIKATYEQSVGSCIFAGTWTAYSDHAILCIDVEAADATRRAS
jgi:endonuclease/exonuclease/phosphatase (EEP) superfamily protein YafD